MSRALSFLRSLTRYRRHRRRPEINPRTPVHVAIRVRPQTKSLRKGQCYRIVREALIASNQKIRYRLVAYSVQGNHLHLIIEAEDTYAVSRAMRGLSIRIARRINRSMKTRGVRIRDRYAMTVLKTPLAAHFALRYVLNNYRRHAGSWGRRLPNDWIDPCSSARWFDGWTRPPARSRDPCPDLPSGIVPAQSALLRRQWSMYGLLEPSAVPGPSGDRVQPHSFLSGRVSTSRTATSGSLASKRTR